MSDSESEGFDFNNVSGSDSDGFVPLKKKKTAAPAKASSSKPKPAPAKSTSKPPAKAKAPPKKKKILGDRDDNPEESVADMSEVEEYSKSQTDQPRKQKSASETYKKLSQKEHVLMRPDSYIGSVETITQNMWTYDSDTKRMVLRDVQYVPGFFKIVDEILVNAADNKVNDANMDTLKVNIDVEAGTISVYNNGRGIPIEIHSKENVYIPELIFGHLLSSSNYDDDEKKLTGGRNGYGAKLTNIYSHEFKVETADRKSGLKYTQIWTDNMSKCGKAKIVDNKRDEEFTRVTFKPDLKRFGMDSIDDDTLSLLKRRVYDMAGTVKAVKVHLNDERLKIKNFKTYVDMYLSSAASNSVDASGGAAQMKNTMIYEDFGARWEIAFAVSDGNFQQVSFANHIATTKGGTHVNLVADQIAKKLVDAITKKNKAAAVKGAQIKNHMWLFVNAMIENPTFDSQTKDTLTLPSSKFGSKPVLSEEFMKKVQKSPIIEQILNWARFKADQQAKKTDGSKRSRLTGLTKLSDANNAGTRNASKCTLILTEGDSAKTLAVAGLSVVGRDNFGVFPLRGKLLNVREASHDQIMKNEEIQNIKKILGLQHNKVYSSVESLRYGQVMIMTDQDHDGSHIKGLLINFLDHFYPSLLKLPNFLVEFITPIVRVKKGSQEIDFFTIPEYEEWLESTPNASKWVSKYYKGLGTSTEADSKGYFSNMAKHMIPFSTMEDEDKPLIDLAFSKKKADERKEWLRQFKPGTYLNHDVDEIPYSDFINKELILFSMADNVRSIPSVMDGLKPGQRKVIWACFKRKLRKEIKVAQLVGYISEHAAYHHGEASLTSTIVNLAQDYVGSNNLNLLAPNGGYGSREVGGKDHASARYIFTLPETLTRSIFNAQDDALLSYLKDDADDIEPEWYMPIIPLVLVNGVEGIGTGWSTSIPSYNPVDIVNNLKRLIQGEEILTMTPWWRGFKGEIKKTGDNKYDVFGIVNKLSSTTVEIRELPIHKWTAEYKKFLETLIGEKGDGVIKDYKEYHDKYVHFVVTMDAKALEKAEEQGLMEFFKLSSKLSTSNMICFDREGKIRRYNSPEAIIEEFYPTRLTYYQKRKDHQANELQDQLDKLTNQARFVQMIVDKQLVVSNRKKADIVKELRRLDFRPFPKSVKAKVKADGQSDEDKSEDEADSLDSSGKADSDFDYLLGMAIWSLTKEKIEKLRQQAGDKEVELKALLVRTPKDMWTEDLDNFLEGWKEFHQSWMDKSELDNKGKKIKRKQTTLKTRKSLTGKSRGRGSDSDDDGGDDDFEVKRPKAAAAKIAKPAVVKPIAPTATKPAAPRPVKAASEVKSKSTLSDIADSDSDAPMVKKAAPKPRAVSKTIATKSKAKALESDTDESGSDFGGESSQPKAPVKAAKQDKAKASKAPARKAKVLSDSDVEIEDVAQDDESDFEVVPTKKATGTKRKSPVSDDSEDEPLPKPVKKKPITTQASLASFLEREPTKAKEKAPAPPKKTAAAPEPAKKPAAKKRVLDSDSEEQNWSAPETSSVILSPPKREPRVAKKAPPAYIDIDSD